MVKPFVVEEGLGRREQLAVDLANLQDNARRAGGPDGSITVVLGECDETLEVTVSDTGPGVPREDRERIFERFVRLGPSRPASGSGNGLGLSIARGFAEAHGAR